MSASGSWRTSNIKTFPYLVPHLLFLFLHFASVRFATVNCRKAVARRDHHFDQCPQRWMLFPYSSTNLLRSYTAHNQRQNCCTPPHSWVGESAIILVSAVCSNSTTIHPGPLTEANPASRLQLTSCFVSNHHVLPLRLRTGIPEGQFLWQVHRAA